MSDASERSETEAPVVSGNTPQTRPENRMYYPALDGLRALALILVFLQHYEGMFWGWTGVDLFFVLSGFLITGILYDTRERTHRVRSFYVRRTLRIFPLYYGLLLALLLSTPLLHWEWNRYWWVWPAYLGNLVRFWHPFRHDLAYLQAANGVLLARPPHHGLLYLGHFWSLCLEEQFYLVWPAVVFLVKDRRRLIWICVAIVVGSPLLRVLAVSLLPSRFNELELTYSATPFRMDALVLGGLLALILRGPGRTLLLTAGRWFAMVAGTVVALLLVWSFRGPGAYVYPAWRLTWGLSLVDLLAASLVLLALEPRSVVYKVLNTRALRWLGRLSYGAYVFHDMPHHFYGQMVFSLGARVPWVGRHAMEATSLLAFVATMVIASLSFRFFESPFLRLKERFAPS